MTRPVTSTSPTLTSTAPCRECRVLRTIRNVESVWAWVDQPGSPRTASAVAVVAPVGPTETADLLVAAAVESFGRLDVLVTNAGVLRDRVLWKTTDEDFDLVVATHLRGTFTTARAAAAINSPAVPSI